MTKAQLAHRYTPADIREVLGRRGNYSVEIDKRQGQPVLKVDNQTLPWFGFVGNPYQWPTHCSHSDFVKAGARLHWVSVVPSNPWRKSSGTSRYGWTTAKYDFAPIDRKLMEILGYDIDAKVLLYFHMNPYPEFGDRHPDSVWRDAEGKKTIGRKCFETTEQKGPGEAWNISYVSEEFRRQGSRLL